MQNNSMNVILTTLIGDMEEEDIFLEVASKIEKKTKTALGIGNTVSSSFSLIKKQLVLKINKHIEILVNITDFRETEKETLTKMEKVMDEYDISQDEIDMIYKNDPSLAEVNEPMLYIHNCTVTFEVGECSNKKYTNVACSLINLITQSNMIINNYNLI